MAPSFIDTHAHIQEPDFKEDTEAVLGRARDAGVAAIVVPGVDVETSDAAALLADRHADVFFAAGFHPHEASRLDGVARTRIRELLSHPRAVAVGEIGLDYYRMHSPRAAQSEALAVMLDLARETRKPVIVHAREAIDDTYTALRSWSMRNRTAFEGRPVGVMHYFAGTPDEARRFVDLGFLISVHTSVTHPKAYQLRQVVTELPLEALVIETDAPYGSPQDMRGKRNEPAFVVEAAKRIAALKGHTLDEVAAATTANAARLFGLQAGNRTMTGAVV